MTPQAVALRRYGLRPTLTDDEALRLTIEGYFLSYGYTALRSALAQIDSKLARENRVVLAMEGWVA